MKNTFKNMSEFQKNKLIIIICICLILLFIIVSVSMSTIKEKEEKKKEYEYKEVVDNNRYFTVMSCVSKFINYLSTENIDNIITVLDNQYILDNNINSTNVFDYIKKVDSNFSYSYDGDIMYERRISDSALEYKVTGYIVKDGAEGTIDNTYYPLIITLYEDKLVFTVRPGE